MLRRPRRNRQSESIRRLTAEATLLPRNLISPLFILDGKKKKESILTMPGQYRFSADQALQEIESSLELGISSFILFPVVPSDKKDSTANYSYAQDSFYLDAIRLFKSSFPEVCIITDVAMDPYSSDGHDGLVQDGEIVNDKTLPILAKMSLAQAEAGANIVGPSDMMDGRVGYIRQALDNNGFQNVGIMAYSVKYASVFYGPFREALNSVPKTGDKKTYQMSPLNKREAFIEAELDYQEGADFLLVKPALHYLDIIHSLKEKFMLPIVAYHVSGEYAMLKASIENGWLDSKQAIEETLFSIKRAGADIIISYCAKEYAASLGRQS